MGNIYTARTPAASTELLLDYILDAYADYNRLHVTLTIEPRMGLCWNYTGTLRVYIFGFDWATAPLLMG